MEELIISKNITEEVNMSSTDNEAPQSAPSEEGTMNLSLNPTIDEHLRESGLTDAQRFAVGLHILCCYSASIGHRPYIHRSFKTYGNLNIILLGKSGLGKGSAKNFALEIFSAFGENTVAPLCESVNISCKKALLRGIHDILNEPSRKARGEIRLFHVNSEFGSALRGAASSYMSELGSSLCRIIDSEKIEEILGKQKISYKLIHYAAIYHIQPEEVIRCMREHLIYSGMVNRFLWFELPKDMNPNFPRMFQETKTKLEDELEYSIDYAAAKREIQMTPEAQQRFEAFRKQNQEANLTAHEVVCNLTSRLDWHVLKLALNLTMLRRQPEVTLDALEEAIALADLSRRTSVKYMMFVVPHTLQLIILNYLKERGHRTSLEIIKDLTNPKISATRIRKELSELEKQGSVLLETIDKGDGFFPKCYKACV